MTPHQTLAVGVRLFAIWLVVTSLRALSPWSHYYGTYSGQVGWVASLLIAVVLWRFPFAVARRILPTQVEQDAPSECPTPDQRLSMGCALIGIWILAEVIPELMRLFESHRNRNGFISSWSMVAHELWPEIVQLLLALVLIFWSRGIRRLYWWTQRGGRTSPADNAP